MAAAASSTMEISRRHRSSSSMGSNARVMRATDDCHPERSEGPLRPKERSLAALGMTEGPGSSDNLRQYRTVGQQPRPGARTDDERAFVFFEHRRPVDMHPGLQRVAIPHLRPQGLAGVGEEQGARALERRLGGMARQRERAAAARHGGAQREPERDELYGGTRRRAREQRLVGRLEGWPDAGFAERLGQRDR